MTIPTRGSSPIRSRTWPAATASRSISPRRVDHDTIDLVKRSEPDVIVVNSWYTWMPPELYNLPPHGTLNLHDSLLPKGTGFSPVIWSLISGQSQIGLTVHRMDENLDTGDVLVQHSLPIGPNDTGTQLVERGIDLIPGALKEALTRAGVRQPPVATAGQGDPHLLPQALRA